MIDKNLVVEYLEPTLWGRLGAIVEILRPAEKVAHVLEEKDGCRAVFGAEVLSWKKAEQETEERLWARFPEADEIRLYTRETIRDFFRAVQCREIYDMDIDEYLHRLYGELAERTTVLRLREKKDRLWTVLEDFCRSDGVYNIGITQGEDLYFQCILEVRGGRLVRITTADRYGRDVFDWEKICENVRNEFSGACVHIMMTLEELRRKY